MKMPALQFYPADWRKDPGVQSLDYFQRGVWFEILCIMHESDRRGFLQINGKKPTDEQLCRLLGLDNQKLEFCLRSILDVGVASVEGGSGILFNRRMVNDERLRQIRAQCGKMGGNPVLVKQNNGLDNQNTTTMVKVKSKGRVLSKPPPSSSLAVTTTLNGAARIPAQLDTPEFLISWDRWKAQRKYKRQTLTPLTEEGQLKKLSAYGSAEAIAIIELAIEKGWQGLVFPKYDKDDPLNPTGFKRRNITDEEMAELSKPEPKASPNGHEPALFD